MVNPFVPEADALEQQREVRPGPDLPEDDESQEPEPALEYPERLPLEASEADALEQNQPVDFDDDLER
jgi:hypothetical protein